ncbi:methyltransferase domain-containing protein [Actinoplanes sp. NPDC024001]|uniref:class I SAM-dependent methyltransferase n=1 Tax=Actinoplanes sp. NPDC024001 TaxID=3154598 RepID=UPI0033DE20B5
MTTPDYDDLYRAAGSRPPWEIGGPQPALAAVLDDGIRGPRVLDAGCGTGDLALALARRGFQVTAVDISPVAIETAQARAAAAGLSVDFQVQDATRLSLPPAGFDTIVDCGLLHNLHRHGGADTYLAQLPALAAPGAHLIVLAVSAAAGEGWTVTEQYLRDAFAEPAWTGARIEETEVVAQVDGEPLSLRGFLLRAAAPPRPASP